MIKEKQVAGMDGYIMIPVLFVFQLLPVLAIVRHITGVDVSGGQPSLVLLISMSFIEVVVFICWFGFFNVQPNQAKVLQLFGNYVGSAKTAGLRWANPLYTKKAVSLRTRNFETSKSKVNDKDGNPIEIGAVVVWSVVDSAEAIFEVDHYEEFVGIQSESALRNLATAYPYDAHTDDEVSLRSHGSKIAEALRVEIQERLDKAGVKVNEARITHLAYAPEIAQAMLQRQQAGAIISARSQIVEGAVSMVEMALQRINDSGMVEMDDERKASMVSNLLVVLCGDHNATPVINTGTLYG